MTHVREPFPHTAKSPIAAARSAAEPLTFDGTIGLFSPASGGTVPSDLAVLFASPWGLEEMSTRKFRRVTAEMLADRGIASLRFDYPGTGDALDDVDFEKGLVLWAESLIAAAERLKALSGCGRIVVVSQGLGTVIAVKAAELLKGLEAIAFLAPVVFGRFHIRELAVWSKVVDENLGLTEEQRNKADVSIASLTMPADIAGELRKVDLMMIDRALAPRMLIVGRADRPADADFAARLQALGAEVTRLEFAGYDRLVSNPTISRLPLAVAKDLVEWVAALPAKPRAKAIDRSSAAPPLIGDGFAETPMRFGTNDRLSGVLCEPCHGRSGATVLFLSSAYDRHAGWGRITVTMARALARSGIASLRFDTANTGDSPPVRGRPEQVLYHSAQNADVVEAIDFLEGRNLAPVVTAGRCSGAYLSFQAALVEKRIVGEVLVNPIVFRWQSGRSVEDAIVNGTRSLNDYGQRAFRTETLKRLLRGEIDLPAACRNIVKGLARQVKGPLLKAFRGVLPEGRAIYGAFRALDRRGLLVSLIYSENDLGLEHCAFYFGRNGAGLSRFPNVSSTIIPQADHNLTPDHARAVYLDAVRQMAFRFRPIGSTLRSEMHNAIAAE